MGINSAIVDTKTTARREYWLVLLIFLPVLILFHLLVAPYTKVEESFHIEATWDILQYGLYTKHEDEHPKFHHLANPGPVPRTAVGAAVLAKLSQWVIALRQDVDHQLLVRAILGLYNSLSLVLYTLGFRRSFGSVAAIWYFVFQCSQFHIIYYASRPLSNMFAFGLTVLSMRYLLPDKVPLTGPVCPAPVRTSLVILTFTAVVFRSELSLLVFTETMFFFASGRIEKSWHTLVGTLVGLPIGVLFGLFTTLSMDSQFWQRWPAWPEFDAFVFNVVEGQSAAWGTAPWHFYFLNALPRLLLNPLTYLVGIPVALCQQKTRSSALSFIIPPLCFVAIYSFLPHKEWRFIVYVIPPLTAAAALGAGQLWSHRSRGVLARAGSYFLVLSTIVTFLVSNLAFLPAFITNYPGALALHMVNQYYGQINPSPWISHTNTSIYLCRLAAETGVTRFLQKPPASGWRYITAEEENLKQRAEFWEQFDFLVVEASIDPDWHDQDEVLVKIHLPFSEWETVGIIQGFAGIRLRRLGDFRLDEPGQSISDLGHGQRMLDLSDSARSLVRNYFGFGWWLDLKIEPKVKVLKRVH